MASFTVRDLPKLKEGYWYVNKAPLGEKPVWTAEPKPVMSFGIFGRSVSQIEAMQGGKMKA